MIRNSRYRQNQPFYKNTYSLAAIGLASFLERDNGISILKAFILVSILADITTIALTVLIVKA